MSVIKMMMMMMTMMMVVMTMMTTVVMMMITMMKTTTTRRRRGGGIREAFAYSRRFIVLGSKLSQAVDENTINQIKNRSVRIVPINRSINRSTKFYQPFNRSRT